MTLTLNGRPTDTGPREEFGLDRDPVTDSPIDPPEQLELKPKTEGEFTRNADKLLKRSGKKIRGGGTC